MTVAEKLIRAKSDIDEVYEAGKQSEWDRFWEEYQKGGAKQNYTQAFYSNRWTDTTYKPKYPIKCSSCSSMFNSATITDTLVDIDISACSSSQYLFGYCTSLQTVQKLKVGENTTFSDSFAACRSLENITFEGVIGQNLDIHWSTLLTADSLLNIVKHLSGSATGKTITLPTTAESTFNAKNDEGAWSAFVATKTNWTFAYA